MVLRPSRPVGISSDLHRCAHADRRARHCARRIKYGGFAALLGAQLAGQMALDMRPRSTCRRLTKAIPVPDMTEACHGDLDTVQLYPSCGHPCPGMWNKGVVAHMRCGTA